MKVIFIMSDTYRRDHLGAYGNTWIHTPNLDRLASFSTVFDQHYIGSFPTIPCRRDIHLGRGDKDAPFNKWRNFDVDETTIAERLYDAHIHSMMINDTANSCLKTRQTNGNVGQMNMNKGFEFFIGNRGQEGDNCWSDAETPLEFPVPHELIRYPANGWHNVLMNRARRAHEDDWYAPGTFKIACDWIERNWRRKDFFLWVEAFDPHEPWDPPQYYIERYDPGYTGRVFDAPVYGYYKSSGITDREVKNIQAKYAGECSMVDHSIGRLLATLDKVNLLEETLIIFTSDHGTYVGHPGDNGLLGKPHVVGADGRLYSAGKPALPPVKLLPRYTGVARVPLFIHTPHQQKAKRIAQITQPWDLSPTIMQLFDQPIPPQFIGQSLLPVIEGKKKLKRNVAVLGDGGMIQAMNEEWIFSMWNREEKHPVEAWNKADDTPTAPLLIDLKNDPLQKKNVAKKYPEICQKLYKEIRAFVKHGGSVDAEEYMAGLVND